MATSMPEATVPPVMTGSSAPGALPVVNKARRQQNPDGTWTVWDTDGNSKVYYGSDDAETAQYRADLEAMKRQAYIDWRKTPQGQVAGLGYDETKPIGYFTDKVTSTGWHQNSQGKNIYEGPQDSGGPGLSRADIDILRRTGGWNDSSASSKAARAQRSADAVSAEVQRQEDIRRGTQRATVASQLAADQAVVEENNRKVLAARSNEEEAARQANQRSFDEVTARQLADEARRAGYHPPTSVNGTDGNAPPGHRWFFTGWTWVLIPEDQAITNGSYANGSPGYSLDEVMSRAVRPGVRWNI